MTASKFAALALGCLAFGCAHVPSTPTVSFPLSETPKPESVYACALIDGKFACVPIQDFMDALEATRRSRKTEEL